MRPLPLVIVSFTQFRLDPRLRRGLERANYKEPTAVQQQAIPLALEGKDLIGTAQTGTGKTAAFVLPILNRLLNGPRRRTRALILTPTRELAEQIHDVVLQLGEGTDLRSATIYGGVGQGPQVSALRNGSEIIIACPGRLLDLTEQGYVNFSNVEVAVLDEADRMLDMGFLPSVLKIIRALPIKRQTMLFSATFDKQMERLAGQALRDPKRVAIGMKAPAQTVSHSLYEVPQHLKTELLLALLEGNRNETALVFTRTKHRARRLATQLERADYSVSSLHGNRSQKQRQEALNGFRQGKYQVLVATDVAARGIDVEEITFVINYDMPDTEDSYIHRIGRTGRAEHSGRALTFVTSEDDAMVHRLGHIIPSGLTWEKVEGFDYTRPAPPRSERERPFRQQRGRGPPRHHQRPPRGQTPRPHKSGDDFGRAASSAQDRPAGTHRPSSGPPHRSGGGGHRSGGSKPHRSGGGGGGYRSGGGKPHRPSAGGGRPSSSGASNPQGGGIVRRGDPAHGAPRYRDSHPARKRRRGGGGNREQRSE